MKRKISWNDREILVKIFTVLRNTSRDVGKFEGFNMARNVLCNPVCEDRYEKALLELDSLIALYEKGQTKPQRLYKGKYHRTIVKSLRISKTILEEIRG